MKRGVVYGRESGGKSLLISFPLILTELSCIFLLGFFELWGKWFNREGINIMGGDFVPMSGANELGAPLRLNGIAPDSEITKLKSLALTCTSASISASFDGDFRRVADLIHEMLREVLALEEQTQSLFPMHRHILESVGVAAVNSITYLEQSQGRTLTLSRYFVAFQIFSIPLCLYFDRIAQKCHELNVGILENDLPYIPFIEAYASLVGDAGGASGEAE